MKKVLFVLLFFLALNFGIRLALRLSIGDSEYPLQYVLQISHKLCLIIGVLIVIYTSKIDIEIWNKKYLFLLICAVIGYWALWSISDETETIPVLNNALFFVSCLCVAAFEELLFRVYVFDGLLKIYTSKKMLRVIVITSLLFAVAHGTNAFHPDVAVYGVIVQIVFAFAIGILFQSLLIRFRNVFLVIALHTVVNYLGSYKSQLLFIERASEEYTFNEFLMSLSIMVGISVLVFLPISYILLRPYFNEKKSPSLKELP